MKNVERNDRIFEASKKFLLGESVIDKTLKTSMQSLKGFINAWKPKSQNHSRLKELIQHQVGIIQSQVIGLEKQLEKLNSMAEEEPEEEI